MEVLIVLLLVVFIIDTAVSVKNRQLIKRNKEAIEWNTKLFQFNRGKLLELEKTHKDE